MFCRIDVDRKAPRAYPVGKSRPKRRTTFALVADRRQLRSGAENHQLAELDMICAQLASQLVQSRLDARRLGDRVSATFSGHISV